MAKEPPISFQDLEVGKLEALLLKIQPRLEAEDFQLLERVVTTLVLVLECAHCTGSPRGHFSQNDGLEVLRPDFDRMIA